MTLSPEEVRRHTLTALTLDEKVENRHFWLSFHIDSVEPGAQAEVAGALANEVDGWLEELEDSGQGELGERPERRFEVGGWHFTVRVAHKGEEIRERGGTIVANPFPEIGYYAS